MIRSTLSQVLMLSMLFVAFGVDKVTAEGKILSAEEFAAIAEGHTLHFNRGANYYGSEQYFSGKRSVWRHNDGPCEYGTWWQDGEAICFSYEDNPTQSCWIVSQRENGIFVRSTGDIDGSEELRMILRTKRPLDCPGPDAGV